ncbi:hypothetical protein IMZ11_32025 [Microtetraspora sp. AC03309]|uniref:hypothetical protein n=1 Tax=Microtetraspora sp. AC03309 TaxID=2779376 RepID=UPI001E2B24B9|nr:hypothetical protein [Microtetraspora sp. AC03309]MCC5580259.1 hypothetical protein [Microtetraspora sp. AC03309]
MSSHLRAWAAGVLFVLAVLAVASALVGAVGHYTVLDRPVLLGTLATSLIIVSGALVLRGGLRGPAIALGMIWMTMGLVTYVNNRQVYAQIPGPTGSGLEVRALYDGWIIPDWALVVRKNDGLLTREWPLVERFSSEHADGLPMVTWVDTSHVRLDDGPDDDRALWRGQVVVLDPETGRPLDPDHPVSAF